MIENLMINMDSDLVHSNHANRMFGYNGTPTTSPSYYLDLEGRSKSQSSKPTYASQPALNYSSQPSLLLDEEDEYEEEGDETCESDPMIDDSDYDEDSDQVDHRDSTASSASMASTASTLGGYPRPSMNGQYKPVASAIVD